MIDDIEDVRAELWNIIEQMPKGWMRTRLTQIAQYTDMTEERL
jgi:hypothetical protein